MLLLNLEAEEILLSAMKKIYLPSFMTALLLAGLLASPSEAKGGGRFTLCKSSGGGFSSVCPAQWVALPDLSGDTIDILSFPSALREPGIVIKEGGAEIIVTRHAHKAVDFEKFILNDNKGTGLINPIHSRKNRKCYKYADVIVDIDQGQRFLERNFQIYCQVGISIYRVRARYFSNDPKWRFYQATAKKIFDNLRILEK